jgi:hypothetical protein
MAIDSTMNGEYHFGIFVYGGAGAALRIRPEKPVPIDNFAVVVETTITSQGMADPAPFTPGERKAGSGLILDGGHASIQSNRFDFIGGILNFRTCVELRGNYTQNEFRCTHLHTNATNGALMTVAPTCGQNTFNLVVGVDQGAQNVRGIVCAGSNNVFELNTRGGFPRGQDLTLEASAQGNRITLIHGAKQCEPGAFITDRSEAADNTLAATGGPIAVRTLPVPAGHFAYTQRLFTATARMAPGNAAIEVQRGDATVPYSPNTQEVLLSPGDRLKFRLPDPGGNELGTFGVANRGATTRLRFGRRQSIILS